MTAEWHREYWVESWHISDSHGLPEEWRNHAGMKKRGKLISSNLSDALGQAHNWDRILRLAAMRRYAATHKERPANAAPPLEYSLPSRNRIGINESMNRAESTQKLGPFNSFS